MAEEKKLEQEYLPEEITEKDVKKSWLTYYFFAETGISYERLQALGFCMSLIPIFKKLYKKKEDFTAALKRHMVFYNTTLQITIPFAFPSSAYLSPICTNTTLTVFLI